MRRICLNLALSVALLLPVTQAEALSVEWKNLAGRERVILRLEPSDGSIASVKRTAANSIGLYFSSGAKVFAMSGPGTSKLFGNIESADGGLKVNLKTPEFGFIVTRPDKNVLYLDLFPDALGRAWTPASVTPKTLDASAPVGASGGSSQPKAKTPVVEANKQAEAKSAAEAAVAQPAGTIKAAEGSKQAENSKPVEGAKPVGRAKSAESAQPEEAVKPANNAKPIESSETGAAVAGPEQPQGSSAKQPEAKVATPEPLAGPEFIDPQQQLAQPELEKLSEPSSVFSNKIDPPQNIPSVGAGAAEKTVEPSSPPAEQPQTGTAGRGADEVEHYKLPEWPPLEMPATLPAPPPPPFSNPSPESGPASGQQSLSTRGGSSPNADKVFGFNRLLTFSGVAYAASANGDEAEYERVEAPFAYRARINVNKDPNWVEDPIPVLVRVPKGTAFAGPKAAPAQTATPDQAAQEPAGRDESFSQSDTQQASEAGGAQEPAAAEAAPAQAQLQEPAAPEVRPEQPQQPAQSGPTAQSPSSAGETAAEPMVQPQPEQPQPEAGVATPVQTAAEEPPQVIVYVDELGNPVEPPLDPQSTLRDIDLQMNNKAYADVIQVLDKLLGQHNLDRSQREIALHRKADAIFSLYENDLVAHYQDIADSSTAAINFNTKSYRNAAVYLRLGYISLKVGNAYEAAAYFNVLRREFPSYENIPLTYYYWGDYQYAQGNLNEAVEQFSYVVNNYPEHQISRDSALGLARSYYRMGEFSDSLKIMLFVEQRWPSFYMDYPPMLSLLGDAAYRVGDLDKARSAYWLYYNLAPHSDDIDMILTRLGDIYSAGKYHSAAIQVYSEAVKRFPAKDGGIIALMRLAEDGIYDEPEIGDMFKVFERPYDKRPAEAYRTIIREYPGSQLVTLAKLKLAMWSLWQKDYVTVLDLSSEIVSEAPNSPLAERAREVAMNAFTMMSAADAKDQRYNRAREVWDRYPILQTQAELLDPSSRLSLAVSQWNSGNNTEAMRTLEPFFYGAKAGDISEQALFLALNIMSEHFQWEKIEDLGRRVETWELTPQAKNQLNYAMALSCENLDRPEAAAPLWASVYAERVLPVTQMSNAAFYLARSAERQRDLEKAYFVGKDALKMLQDVALADPAQADEEKIKTQLMSLVDLAESSGSLQDAMEYCQKYLEHASEGSLDQQSVIYRIARIHKKRGDTADWAKMLEDIAGKYPDSVFGKTAKSELTSYRLGSEAARFSNTQF